MNVCSTCKYTCKGKYSCCEVKPDERKPVTNADKIRAMTDEELAKILCRICPPEKSPTETCFYAIGDNKDGVDCVDELCWLDWLKQEAKI